jgi:thioredoxin 2
MSQPATSIQVACPHCSAVNRLPAPRLTEAPNCGACKRALFTGRPLELTASNFDAHTQRSDLPLLVDFGAAWCGPCRNMAPAFEAAALQLEPYARTAKLDTEAEQALAGRYAIRSIPTLVLIHHGKELARQSGALSREQIIAWTRSHLPRS